MVSIPQSGFWVFKRVTRVYLRAAAGGFNPSVGILGVQALGTKGDSQVLSRVSIPQSGFWVFKHILSRVVSLELPSFNPSVGILGVQAKVLKVQPSRRRWFQSLSRDSGCSSL